MSPKKDKNIVFTLCSNNYLAQAKVLGDSLLRYNPNYHFIIGLVDEFNKQVDYTCYERFEILPATQIPNLDVELLSRKYNIIELNTCVKASFIKHLKNIYPNAKCIFYFDPDIKIFDTLESLESELKSSDILLTPHIVSPLPLDNQLPKENTFLNYGIYNLGFLGIKPSSRTVDEMLEWWEKRILEFGYDRTADGYFVDQIWANLMPLFFDKVKVLKSLGYNMAPWNLHERKCIRKDGEGYRLPDETKLVFFHFSNYNVDQPERISKYFNRYNLSDIPVVKELYDNYRAEILSYKIHELSQILCAFKTIRQESLSAQNGARYYLEMIVSKVSNVSIALCRRVQPCVGKRGKNN